MKWIVGLAIVSSVAMAEAPMTLSQQALVPVSPDIDKKTYAAVDLPFDFYKPLFKKAEEIAGQKLDSRGEAHMTILTPPEIMRVDGKVRLKLLEEFKHALATESIKAVCIGRGKAEVKGKLEWTYFVVVEASAIKALREKYGLKDFYPHVTLGFTKRDLHFEDGVRKDKDSCVADVTVTAD